MPHVGGGSHSGGFHSSSSGTSSIPRTDVYGRTHSRYYKRPGYYYHGIYVPYSRRFRLFNAIRGYFFLIIFTIAFFAGGAIALANPKSDDKLTDHALNRYSEVYKHDASYEYNLLIEIVAYDNLTEIDYLPIVGDNVFHSVDDMFGNQQTEFGYAFAQKLSNTNEKVANLYTILAEALEETNSKLSTKYYTHNTFDSKVVNTTNFDCGDKTALEAALQSFYNITGYNISVDVSNFGTVYKPNIAIAVVLFAMGTLGLAAGIFSIIKAVQAVKAINAADKKGDLKNYYEGEVSFEEHTKRHSMDEPYIYNKNEYDDLRKSFEINNKDFEINKDDYK